MLAGAAALLSSGCTTEGVKRVRDLAKDQYDTYFHPVVSSAPVAVTASDSDEVDVPTTKAPAPVLSDALRRQYLDAINAVRAETQKCGERGVFGPAPALTWSVALEDAAYEHSRDMARSNTFSHTGSGQTTDATAHAWDLGRGSKFYERMLYNGYGRYAKAGENIAAGYPTPDEVIDAWLASDHHCANLMDPDFTEAGMVMTEHAGSNYRYYWTQELGRR